MEEVHVWRPDQPVEFNILPETRRREELQTPLLDVLRPRDGHAAVARLYHDDLLYQKENLMGL